MDIIKDLLNLKKYKYHQIHLLQENYWLPNQKNKTTEPHENAVIK